MNAAAVPMLSADDLRALAAQHRPAPGCPCAVLRCPGWETLPGTVDVVPLLRRIGRLGGADPYDEPTHAEYHRGGTRYESPDAPVALAYFPYNRCELWQCVHCARPFLRYTEYGGYYVDPRIRAFNVALLVDDAAPPPR